MDCNDDGAKQKILDTIRVYEKRCALLQQDNNKLKSNLTYLSSIVEGLSAETDQYVTQLHALLGGDDQIALPQEVEGLIETIVRSQRSVRKNSGIDIDVYVRLLESLQSLKLPDRDIVAINDVFASIKNNQDKQLVVDKFHDVFSRVLQFLRQRLSEESQTKKTGLLGRFTSIGDSNNANLFNEMAYSLDELVHNLSIPREYERDALAISRRLSNQEFSEADITEIVGSIVTLVAESSSHEYEEFKVFLESLTSQIASVENFMVASQKTDELSQVNTQQMQSGVTQGLNNINEAMKQPSDLKKIAAVIGDNLEIINGSLQNFQESETERLSESKNQMDILNQRLKETEKEVEELRLSLSFQRHRARHDNLTGVPNREAYNEHIVESVQRWQRGYGELSLVICDIDLFKKVNDTYGHLAGDKVLAKVASTLRSSLRAVDFVARYGGEEFVIIMEKTVDTEAAQVMEKLRELVSACPFRFRDKPVNVTMSFGVTSYRPGESSDEVFSRADEALYQAKSRGRNQVVLL